jgi:hypothetical protein
MKLTGFISVAALLFAATLCAAELKSGLQEGDSLDAFNVEKCAGAVNDNVEVGKTLCYRCMLGDKPVVMVWARKSDKALADLVKQLDKKVSENADQKLSSFVNLIGEDPDKLKADAKELATKNKIENIAIVVPEEHANGPEAYKINPEAEVTVLIYRGGKVAANHAVAPGKLDKKEIDSIVADTKKILK